MESSSNKTVLMKPEGSRKIAILNGSRQLDQVVQGEWVTLKVLPENGLPKGIYQLSEAKRPPVTAERTIYCGQLLQVDKQHVFQLHGTGILVHERQAFRSMEALAAGQQVSVTYQNGRVVQ